MLKRSTLIVLLFLVAFSCKKKLPVPNNGIYRGVFREIRSSGDTVASGVVYLALFEESSSFQLVGDSLTNAPASHGGTFIVDVGNRMNYSNSSGLTQSYDSDHYLDTTYEYIFDDELFEFWFQDDTILYEYRLSRD